MCLWHILLRRLVKSYCQPKPQTVFSIKNNFNRNIIYLIYSANILIPIHANIVSSNSVSRKVNQENQVPNQTGIIPKARVVVATGSLVKPVKAFFAVVEFLYFISLISDPVIRRVSSVISAIIFGFPLSGLNLVNRHSASHPLTPTHPHTHIRGKFYLETFNNT